MVILVEVEWDDLKRVQILLQLFFELPQNILGLSQFGG